MMNVQFKGSQSVTPIRGPTQLRLSEFALDIQLLILMANLYLIMEILAVFPNAWASRMFEPCPPIQHWPLASPDLRPHILQ